MRRRSLPAATSFKQQKLRACTPILTPNIVITSFFIIGIVFIPIGAILLVQSNNIVEIVKQYDDHCSIPPTQCNITITIPNRVAGPVYAYYGLTNYNQNHRIYVASRSDTQLRGKSIESVSDASTCDPLTSVNDSSDRSALYVPCGLIAHSTFNDTFSLVQSDGRAVSWTSDGIAWNSDLNGLYGGYADSTGTLMDPPVPGCTDLQNCSFRDPDFVVWMRVAALPSFRKLYRIIPGGLEAGTYTVFIDNNYPTHQFNGKKRFVLSTSSWIGGKNDFLGISYLVVGSLCFVSAILFLIKHKISPRNFGDVSLIEWMDQEGPEGGPREPHYTGKF